MTLRLPLPLFQGYLFQSVRVRCYGLYILLAPYSLRVKPHQPLAYQALSTPQSPTALQLPIPRHFKNHLPTLHSLNTSSTHLQLPRLRDMLQGRDRLNLHSPSVHRITVTASEATKIALRQGEYNDDGSFVPLSQSKDPLACIYAYLEDDDEWVIEMCESGDVHTAYKRVDKKVKPVPGTFPESARVHRRFPENPLNSLSPLTPNPPEFLPNGRLTHDRLKEMNFNSDGFLWPEEEKLFKHILQLNQDTLVFEENQRGNLREDYFTPYIIPTVPHIPWAFTNIPIPPGIRGKVVDLLKEKVTAGVYEPSQSSYRSRWFCVLKKNGKLRIVHDLQPLNGVTIRDAGVPPILDAFVEPFAGRQCYTAFDLHWGFDARKIDPQSRDLTAFMSPLGLLRLTSLPMGFTNSPAEFQACMAFILKDEMPHIADIFIDDLPIKGPATCYPDQDGHPEVLQANPGLRRFIWEHALDVHRIMHRIGHAGATFSPSKVQLARREIIILGHKCTPEGRVPDPLTIDKVTKWPPLRTPKNVREFLGLCGTARIWIKDYSSRARPLTELIRHGAEFIWDERRQAAFDDLKHAITTAPVLMPIDYESDRAIVMSVDSSFMAVGFILSQKDEQGRKRPARYGSIPFNEREARYSQPKLELYGLFRALRAFRLYLVGAKVLEVEVDAKYIKGMLNEPDLQPNASINRWIQGILLFDFKLIHVPAEKHQGPDALSRRELGEGECVEDDDDSWLDEIALLSSVPHESSFESFHITYRPLQLIPVYLMTNTPQDQIMKSIYDFLSTMALPTGLTSVERKKFLAKTQKFFIKDGKLYRRNGIKPALRAIFSASQRLSILQAAHEDLGHRGEQAVMHTLHQRFYWPHMWNDVRHHVRSCHECQVRSTKKVEVPLTISRPTTLFTKVYVDIMHMDAGMGHKYIVAARDDLSRAAEGRALRDTKARTLARFFWEEILCRYGMVGQVVTDNGPEVLEAFTELMRRYGIPHIKISPYNSKANGVVERGHFTIRESIMKACRTHPKHWPEYVHYAFFADKVTISQSTGFSAYYLLHGVHPVLPLDLLEATFLVEGFHAGMSTAELLSLRIQQLQKKPEDIDKAAEMLAQTRSRSKEQFENKYRRRLFKNEHQPGELVLVRNTTIEKSMNRKCKPRYLGPYQVVRRTLGGSYVLQELDGAIWRQKVAAFRLLPYVTRDGGQLEQLITRQEYDRIEDTLQDEA